MISRVLMALWWRKQVRWMAVEQPDETSLSLSSEEEPATSVDIDAFSTRILTKEKKFYTMILKKFQ